ncbi:MAG: prepilin-type N-terminal cleavage/methylation domain-containing protein [Armatimonadota bacterium]|nr:prepilin-type N-terminal cleavage/methylation domain-containing protein [Armatimonadota bacterium]MDR7519579.1 prepilin-type N-terminal cleavage/methylation domain-containing protein [Armatimonadota bacterium]MDR7550150.1 prepilin-type N-terminal cleavage/methylation domain-containing protein [Armatimonadota bacterium]
MTRRPTVGPAGYTLIELVIALALASIVMALIGSLFVASLSTWRRGTDLREAQGHATGLVEVMARDVRNASQAPSVTIRPRIAVPEGDPLLAITAGEATAAGGGSAWIVYVHNPERREILRLVVAFDPAGRAVPREVRLMATGVERVTLQEAGDGVTVEVAVRRGREVVTSRATAAPRNP